MVTVSEAWKVKQTERLAPEGFVEIQYRATDPSVQEEAVASDGGHAYFANTAQITNITRKSAPLYATTERNIWLLNGRMQLVPGYEYGDTGFVSGGMTNTDSVFNVVHVITL